MNGLLLAIGTGVLIVVGVWAPTAVLLPVRPRLVDALDLLDGRPEPDDEPQAGGIDRLGGWMRARLRRPVSAGTRRRLRMAGRSVERHDVHKALGGFAGLVLPGLAGGLLAAGAGLGAELPAALGVGCGLLGFVLPDLLLRRGDSRLTEDATESLLTYFDLVTLERLANSSGSQALRAAALVSDTTVFAAIRETLERARLEQRPPYPELQRLGRDLELPALVDLADVMALDEAGAALSGALRARVRELRDAHLTQARIGASAVSERMAFFMVVPSLVFGLVFLVPPLLRLIST
jgi:hypothetical protein